VPRSSDYIMLVQFVQEVNKLDGCNKENRERGVEYKENFFMSLSCLVVIT
jgi:hypothetical protein